MTVPPKLLEQYGDRRRRLNSLYWITDKSGHVIKFVMNAEQERLYDNMHYLNIILKARQLGFSTFIQILMLDACLWTPNIRAGVIAHTRDDAAAFFKDKLKFAYDKLPEWVKLAVPAQQDSAQELSFANNSSIRVGTSMRSGTVQILHVSEFGKIAAQYPEKAREIRTGAFGAVHAGQYIFIESTAEGQEGDFFDLCEQAQARDRMGDKLTPLDFKFHFVPWFKHPDYRMEGGPPIPKEYLTYFDKLEGMGIDLGDDQKVWYVRKAEQMMSDMKREYPSYPAEAFEASLLGCYYADQMARAESDGRICEVLHEEGRLVDTWWDLGGSGNVSGDLMAIWFVQHQFNEIHFIDYYQMSGEDLPHYAKLLKTLSDERGYVYGRHFWPHDGGATSLGRGGKTLAGLMGDLGVQVDVQPRADVQVGIHTSRQLMSRCWWDRARCSDGIRALKSYRKEWDAQHGIWKLTPRHDTASHGADAFRTGAMVPMSGISPSPGHRRERYTDKPVHPSSWAA